MDAFSWEESHKISILLNEQVKAKVLSFLLSDSWSTTFALSCLSLFLQIIHILLHSINTFRRKPGSVIETEPNSLTDSDSVTSTFSHSLKKVVKSHGGWTIYLFMIARLFGCLFLFALSVNSCQKKNHPGFDDEGFVTLTLVNPSFLVVFQHT
jgi:hypothetical protein